MDKVLLRLRTLFSTALNHQGFMRYGRNTAWLMGEKIVRMFVGLSVGIWVTRYLGPERFGLLSYAQSFVFLFVSIATLGLDGIVVRELVKDESRRDVLLGTAFVLKFIASILILSLLWLGVQLTGNDGYTHLLIFIIASATIFQSFNVIDFYYQSKVMSKYVALANTIMLLLSSIIKVILILNNGSLTAFATVFLLDAFVLSAGLIYFYIKTTGGYLTAWRFDAAVARGLLKDSWPVILSGIVLAIQARVDQVMLREMIGNREIGYYSAGMMLIEAFSFIPVVMQKSLFPAVENAKQESMEKYYRRLTDYNRVSFFLFLVVAIPIFMFSKPFVILLYGKEFYPVVAILPLLSIRLFFTNMGMARGMYILSENLFIFSAVTMALGALTNIVLNYFLIPILQSRGAIIATIISFSITTFICDAFYSKTRTNLMIQLRAIFTFYKMGKI